MEQITTGDGEVTLDISGTYTPQALRELLKKLCEAHADAAQARFQGHPLFSYRDATLLAGKLSNGLVRIIIAAPDIGCVATDIEVARAKTLEKAIRDAANRRPPAGPRVQ